MFPKLVSLTLTLVLVAGGLLVLRQQRLELAHEIAQLHQEINQIRFDLWQAQALTAAEVAPAQLRPRIDSSQLALEPIIEEDPAQGRWVLTDPTEGSLPR